MIQAFDTPRKAKEQLDDLKAYWNRLLSLYTIDSHDPKLNRMVNIWNPYQCMVTFNLSRSASFLNQV